MKKSSGFTVTELVVALAVIALVTALGIPAAINATGHYGPRYAADVLYGDLQLARMRAARNNQRCMVVFNAPLPNQYTIFDMDNNNAILGTFKIGDLTDYRGGPFFRAASPVPADPPPMATLTFLSQGVVTNILPAGSNAVYISNQDNTKQVRVFVSVAGGTGIDEINPGDNANIWR